MKMKKKLFSGEHTGNNKCLKQPTKKKKKSS